MIENGQRMRVEWDNEKNELLKQSRGISFEDVEQAVLDQKMVDIIPHFNRQKYPNQKIMIVLINHYIHYVPFVQEGDRVFLKTIVPSRKLNKIYNPKD